MINNQLTKEEFKKIITTIIKLDEIDIVKRTIYKILHFTKAEPIDKKQYRICSETTGINSTYKGFDIEIRKLNDPENGYTGSIILLKKRKSLRDLFLNPKRGLVKELVNFCDAEVHQSHLRTFDPGGIVENNVVEEFLYQAEGFNPYWKEQDKLSPLSIYTKEDSSTYLIEFIFMPSCYQRKADKTMLRNDWLEIFTDYTPSS